MKKTNKQSFFNAFIFLALGALPLTVFQGCLIDEDGIPSSITGSTDDISGEISDISTSSLSTSKQDLDLLRINATIDGSPVFEGNTSEISKKSDPENLNPVDSIVDFTLTPSSHKNLQGSQLFTWTITDASWNDEHSTCFSDGVCVSVSDLGLRQVEWKDTKQPNAQFQFENIGVYDVFARIKGIDNIVYERSLVVEQCISDLEIIEESIIEDSESTKSSNKYTQLSLQLKGQPLDDPLVLIDIEESPVLTGGTEHHPVPFGLTNTVSHISAPHSTTTTTHISAPHSTTTTTHISAPHSTTTTTMKTNITERTKIRWKLMAELEEPTYGKWFSKLHEQQGGTSVFLWDWKEYGYNNFIEPPPKSAALTGNVIVQAFVQFPGEECVHAARTEFQIPEGLINDKGSKKVKVVVPGKGSGN